MSADPSAAAIFRVFRSKVRRALHKNDDSSLKRPLCSISVPTHEPRAEQECKTDGGDQQQGIGDQEGGLRAAVGRPRADALELGPEPGQGSRVVYHWPAPGTWLAVARRSAQFHLLTEDLQVSSGAPNGTQVRRAVKPSGVVALGSAV